jgi:hypothetical protein
MFATIVGRLQVYLIAGLAAVAGALAVVAMVFRKGEKSGRDAVIVEQKEKVDAVRQKHDEIDARSPDFDAAIGRLRAKAGDRDAD